MVRPHYQLHSCAEPATPSLAVALILVRDAPQESGLEVLLTRHPQSARLTPGTCAFPGGALESGDADAAQKASRRPQQSKAACIQAAAAIRLCFETLGLLLACRADGAPATDADIQAGSLCRDQPLASGLQKLGWSPAVDRIFDFGHWSSGRSAAVHFEAPFLIAMAPAAQTGASGSSDAIWISPALALQRHADASMPLDFPVVRSLQRLAGFDSAQAAMAACASGALMAPSCPRSGFFQQRVQHYMEHEPQFGELHLVCPDGAVRHTLDWQSDRPVPLLRHVQRLTVPNGGIMTGPGTNTYVVGEAGTGFLVLDPGPDEPAHLQRLLECTGGDIRHIVCTHSHPDHAPGAKPLQAMTQAMGLASPGIHGMHSGPHAHRHSHFTPGHEIRDGDRLTLQNGSTQHTLRALHTPGHAANHLCFVLEQDRLLFSGDHILGGGETPVVLPPDGSMHAYIDSLDLLAAECHRSAIEFMLPGHGHVMDRAGAVIAAVKAHRLKREAKVLQAIEALPQGSIDDWVAIAYADTRKGLWPVARFSLLAHVQRLQVLRPDLGLDRITMPARTGD